ncbi:MAG: response regulator transcription factor [Alphaproteobacteria bacterium]|nr:response regulator transcription factor [Alphaproteobacteria bacterium]
MSKIKSSYGNSARDFERPRHRSGRDNALRSRHVAIPQRLLSETGRKTILYLAIETDDASILGVIRAALPQGSRLHVRFAGDAPSSPWCKAGEGQAYIGLPELTVRQRDILDLLAEGLSNKEIGRKLSLSHFTVRNHISQVMRLLDASTRKEVVARIAGSTLDAIPAAGLAAK